MQGPPPAPCQVPIRAPQRDPAPLGDTQSGRVAPGAPPTSGSPHTDPPAWHGWGDVLPGGRHGAPAARPQGPLPGAVREAVRQGAEHLLLLLGAAQALVVASLAHGQRGGGGCGTATSEGLCGGTRACLGVARAGAGLGITWQKVAAVPENSERVKVTVTVMEGRGGWRDAEEMGKRKGEAAPRAPVLTPVPAWHRCLPPGSAAQMLACCPHSSTRAKRRWHRCQPQRHARSPLLPPPRRSAACQRGCGAGSRAEEEEEDEGGASSSSRGSVARGMGEEAPYPLPGHLRKGGGGPLGLAASPASLPLPCAGRGGWDVLGRWLLRSNPAALAHARQGWESSQAPAGAAGMWAGGAHQEDSSQDQSSPLTLSQGAGGLLDLCQVLHQAQPPAGAGGTGKPPPPTGNPPTCTSRLARTPTLPGRSTSLSPLAQAEIKEGPCSPP